MKGVYYTVGGLLAYLPCKTEKTMRGRFITLEGGEGVGKSTQIHRLAQALQGRGISCCTTREPGGTAFGEQVRSLMMNHGLGALEELLLLLAARSVHVRTVIEPALAQGQWVLCDRFTDSSLVYQGFAVSGNWEWVQQWHERAGIVLVPDLTFLLQVPVEEALCRRRSHKESCNKFDEAPYSFHQKVAVAYETLASFFSDRYICLSFRGPIEALTEVMVGHLMERWDSPP